MKKLTMPLPSVSGLLALGLAALTLFWEGFGLWSPLLVTLKPLPALALAWGVWAARAPQFAAFSLALLLSAIGDFFLAHSGTGWFIAGMSSFTLAQLGYSWGFWRQILTQPPARRALIAWITGFIVLGIGLYVWTVPHVPSALTVPIIVYALLMTSMITGAFLQHRQRFWLRAGAALFYLSDVLIIVFLAFNPPVPQSMLILIPYYAGLILLARGIRTLSAV